MSISSTRTAYSHAVRWVSPQGYANVGTYIHGTVEQTREIVTAMEDREDAYCRLISQHRSREAAQAKAERGARSASARHRSFGDDDIAGSESARRYLSALTGLIYC